MPPKVSRKFNGKSRSGCAQCKRRRVKCDCIGPICSNCRRRQEHCSYLGLLTRALDKETAAGNATLSVTATGLPPDRLRRAAAIAAHAVTRDSLANTLPPENLRADEAELNHHFTNLAWQTFSILPNPRACELWSRWIPQLASRHIFIQQTMLCLSAAHLCRLGPPDCRRYYFLAYQYAIQASNCFRLAMRDLSDDNWVVIAIFSLGNGIFMYQRAAMDEAVMGTPCTLDPATKLVMMRVGGHFSASIKRYMDLSPIGDKVQQVDPEAWRTHVSPARGRVLTKIARLEQWLMREGGDGGVGGACAGDGHGDGGVVNGCDDAGAGDTLPSAETAAYATALAALVAWIDSLPGGKPLIHHHFVSWTSLLPEDYLRFLKEEGAMALMILLLWCEIMAEAPERWFLRSWFGKAEDDAREALARQEETSLHRYWSEIGREASEVEEGRLVKEEEIDGGEEARERSERVPEVGGTEDGEPRGKPLKTRCSGGSVSTLHAHQKGPTSLCVTRNLPLMLAEKREGRGRVPGQQYYHRGEWAALRDRSLNDVDAFHKSQSEVEREVRTEVLGLSPRGGGGRGWG